MECKIEGCDSLSGREDLCMKHLIEFFPAHEHIRKNSRTRRKTENTDIDKISWKEKAKASQLRISERFKI